MSFQRERKVQVFGKELGEFRGKDPFRRILWNTKENRFASSRARDGMINFQYPFQGSAGTGPSGAAQTAGFLVVLILVSLQGRLRIWH